MDIKRQWKSAKIWRRGICAFAGTYGVCYLWSIAGIIHASFSVLSAPVMLLLFGLLGRTERQLGEMADKRLLWRRVRYGAMVSFLFSVAMIMGYQLQNFGMTGAGVRGKLLILLRGGCLGIAVFPFTNMLFSAAERIPLRGPVQEGQGKWKSGKVFGISAAAVFLCLVPVWLAYYPVIMSYDFHRQLDEASKGFTWFWPYQPIAHTWLIWLFLRLGRLLGDLQAGMACMALFQMLVYSLAAGYACAFLYRILRRPWTVAAGILFFGVFPLNSVLALCATKDVLFGTFFLLFVLLLGECFFFSRGKRRIALSVLLVAEGCLMMQFRNNCIYAVAAFGVCWVLAAGKERDRKSVV